MKKKLALALLALLAACDSGRGTFPAAYTAPRTPGFVLCVAQCQKSREYCAEECGLDYHSCYSGMQAEAQKAYEAYVSERFAKKLQVTKWPHDFEDSKTCDADKRACLSDCEDPYKSCYTSCGGKVSSASSCTFFCSE